MKRIIFIFFFFLNISAIFSQNSFTQEELFAYIRKYHPIAKQAALLQERGKQEILKSKGAFDPYIFSDLDQKYFSGKQYYSLFDAGLKIPTWYGADVKVGYDQNQGLNLNPEHSTPTAGLLYAGVSVPLAQGLKIDRRRATVKQAEIFAQSTEIEQLRILNNLFMDAAETYWKWTAAWNQVKIYEDALSLAQTRFEMTRQSLKYGDRAAIDTTEAFLQVQDRQFNLAQSQLLYQNATLELSNFLWYENAQPLEITDKITPIKIENRKPSEPINSDSLQLIMNQLAANHPDLMMYQFKMQDLDIEQKWKKEKLKPKVNFQYNFLTYSNKSPLYNFPNQYKWGFDIAMPIFLREARGDLALTRIKMKETAFSLDQKNLEIRNKVQAYYNEIKNLNGQIKLYYDMTNNYQQLLRAEKIRFDMGESSLFLVNAREVSLISAQLKYIELSTKYNKSLAALRWASGQLN